MKLLSALLLITGSFAFQDTSPFIFFSSSDVQRSVEGLTSSSGILKTDYINTQLEKALSNCPTDNYIHVLQRGVRADDFTDDTPWQWLRRRLLKTVGEARSTAMIADVFDAAGSSWGDKLTRSCKGLKLSDYQQFQPEHGVGQWIQVELEQPPASKEERRKKLADNDDLLNSVIESIVKAGQSYTVIFQTLPPTTQAERAPHSDSHHEEHSEMDFNLEDGYNDAYYHTDLKRDMSGHIKRQQQDNSDQRALFERYNYLSPGFFMAFLTLLLLLSITYVGFSALGSLEITHAAFSKEMGPSQQKKQQ